MNLIEKEMDLNDEPIHTMEDLNAYGERVYGSIGYVYDFLSLFL